MAPAVLPGLERIMESLGIGGDEGEHDDGHDTHGAGESEMDGHDHRRRRSINSAAWGQDVLRVGLVRQKRDSHDHNHDQNHDHNHDVAKAVSVSASLGSSCVWP